MMANSSLNRPKDNSIFSYSETHLNSYWSNSELHTDGFKIIRKDRSYAKGGGLLIYIPFDINFRYRDDIGIGDENSHLEYIWLEIQCPKAKSFLVCFIHQPGNNNLWREQLNHMLREVDDEQKEILMLGDFNINFADKKEYKSLYNITSKYQLVEIIDSVTRPASSTIIDHIYTSRDELVLELGVLKISLSDHLPIFITRKINSLNLKQRHSLLTIKYRCKKIFKGSHSL